MTVTRIPDQKCPVCARQTDAATSFEEGVTPSEGSIVICWSCGCVAQFDAALVLSQVTPEQWMALDAGNRAHIKRHQSAVLDRIAERAATASEPAPTTAPFTKLEFLRDEKMLELLGIREEAGWTGGFSRKQFPGALANGSRVVKCFDEVGDTHTLGARATVLGSIQKWPWEPVGYFVEWDDRPKHAVLISGRKIGLLAE